MRKGCKYARTITGIALCAAGTAVIHTTGKMVSIQQNLMAALAFNMRNKAYATTVFLVGRVV